MVVLLFSATGCFTADVTKTAGRYNVDYVPGADYRTQQPVFLHRISSGLIGKRTFLWPTLSRYAGKPQTVGEYERDPDRWRDFLGVLPAGSTLRITRITRTYNPVYGDQCEVYARILEGVFAGTNVRLDFISNNSQWEPRVDPSFMILDSP